MIDLEFDQQGNMKPFQTKTSKYKGIKIGQPIGIRRWTEWEKMQIVFGAKMSFAEQFKRLHGLEILLAEDKPFKEIRLECILLVNEMRRQIMDTSKESFHMAFRLAALFILREDEDPLTVNDDVMEEKIADWEKSGVNEQHLFFFATALTNGWKEAFQQVRQEQVDRLEKLSDATS